MGIPILAAETVQHIQKVTGLQVDITIYGDGSGLPPSLPWELPSESEDARLIGVTSLLYLPPKLPYKTETTFQGSKAWVASLKHALMKGGASTKCIAVITSRVPSASPEEAGILHQPFELSPLRKFLHTTMVLTQGIQCTWDSTGPTQQPTGMLLLYTFHGNLNFSPLPPPRIVGDPARPTGFRLHPTPADLTQHVVMCGPSHQFVGDKAIPMTGARWLMWMNGISLDERSTVLGNGGLRFARDVTPTVQWPSRCPDGMSIMHLFLKPTSLAELLEDQKEWDPETTAQFSLLHLDTTKLSRLYLISHWPRRNNGGQGMKKQQADEVCRAIGTCPGVRVLALEALPYDRWEVLAVLRSTELAEQCAKELRNWDDYSIRHMLSQNTIRPTTGRTGQRPPFVWAVFPLGLSVDFLLTQLEEHFSIADWATGVAPGELLLRLHCEKTCAHLYGCQIPVGELGALFLTSGEPGRDRLTMDELGISPEDDLLSRIQASGSGPETRLTEGRLAQLNATN